MVDSGRFLQHSRRWALLMPYTIFLEFQFICSLKGKEKEKNGNKKNNDTLFNLLPR